MQISFTKPLVELMIAFQGRYQSAQKAPAHFGAGPQEEDERLRDEAEGALIRVLFKLCLSGKDWMSPLAPPWRCGSPGLPVDSPNVWVSALVRIGVDSQVPTGSWDGTKLRTEEGGDAEALPPSYILGNMTRAQMCHTIVGMCHFAPVSV